ncbi:collagenase [Streptomyces sp. RPT161]|uniref:collagenase n=1 Tax=Streptomyces sp. RPT161 TaxID=3015993 RepID=UPI0022B87BE7|nr:collagenase [Streptomyces sp. RPT161]
MRSPLPRSLSVGLAAFATVVAMVATPALAVPGPTAGAKAAVGSGNPVRALPPTGATTAASDRDDVQRMPLAAAQLRPHSAITQAVTPAASASCVPADFGSRSGSALVAFVRASAVDCVNTLFSVTGKDAHNAFREAQMVTVAKALRSASAKYPGNDSTSVQQLVLFLRAGYYVQYNDSRDVGSYGRTLATAVEGALDSFVASRHFKDVSDANGAIAGEAIILTDSANEQARYLSTYKRVLNGYNSSYNKFSFMVNAVNDVYTPLFRGHQNPAFVKAVTRDPSIIDTLNTFARKHLSLLGTGNSVLTSNAGAEMGRFLQHPALQAKVRPLMRGLLKASKITGRTATLWVAVAQMADSYDKAHCAYYSTCNLTAKLTAAALPITHACDATRTIRAQALTPAELAATCASLQKQDGYFHSLVKDNGPIPNQHEDSIQVVVFASRTDYQTYAGAIFGVDTNNGGITLTGDPTNPANQARSLTYQKGSDDGFVARIWNLNHEYTHYLDGRYDMKGDFSQEITVPDVWWIEGLAEYVSYRYRGVTDTEAVAEAAKHTYALSTLWQNTYDNSDVTRTYPWGYLAVRYMVEKHPADIENMLAKFRVGDYAGGYAVYDSGIGSRYDADFNTWLDACAAGACVVHGGQSVAFGAAGRA